MQIYVTWKVEDGYVNLRPQTTIIDTSFYDWDEMSDSDKRETIDQAVQDDFDQRISFYIEDYGI